MLIVHCDCTYKAFNACMLWSRTHEHLIGFSENLKQLEFLQVFLCFFCFAFVPLCRGWIHHIHKACAWNNVCFLDEGCSSFDEACLFMSMICLICLFFSYFLQRLWFVKLSVWLVMIKLERILIHYWSLALAL